MKQNINISTAPEGTQSIIRALRVLKYFDDHHTTWDLQELAQESGLNKTTLFRILGALESEGLIDRLASNGRYILGSEMIALGGRAARANNLRHVAHSYLQSITDLTGETTTLEILHPENQDQWSMLVIDEVLGKYRVGITQYIGSRLPIHATSTGKTFLAYVDAKTKSAILEQELIPFTEKTLSCPSDLTHSLQEIRRKGFATALGELESGLIAISAPIFDTNGDIQAAASLVGPSVRIQNEHIPSLADILCNHAQEISHRLGYRESDHA